MKTTHLRIVVILLSLAFSWLLVIGIGGWIGVLLGAVLCLLVLLLFLKKDIHIRKEDFHAPLLLSVGMIAVAIYLIVTIHNKSLLPVFVLIALAGVEEIVFWIVDKCYEGKSFLKNLSDEFRLPPYCDLALAICLIVDLLKGSIVFSPIVCLLLLLFILDFTRQIKRLKKREKWLHFSI